MVEAALDARNTIEDGASGHGYSRMRRRERQGAVSLIAHGRVAVAVDVNVRRVCPC